MLEALFNAIKDVLNTRVILILIVAVMPILIGLYVVFLYYFNKYYTNKYKNDFFYLFWGYIDTENNVSADKHLSLIIYHFIGAYISNSRKYFNKRYKFFPEDIKDMDPASFMPNATKGNLEKFEKKHMKWLKFNIISRNVIIILASVVFLYAFLINNGYIK